jgi:hypothetical protein
MLEKCGWQNEKLLPLEGAMGERWVMNPGLFPYPCGQWLNPMNNTTSSWA